MKKIVLSFILFTALLISCNSKQDVKVTYISTDAISAYNLQYIASSGELIDTSVMANSAQDVWKYEFMSEQGAIVYLSGHYQDVNSALQLSILIDGKVYKQGSNAADTLSYLTISGTVPFKN